MSTENLLGLRIVSNNYSPQRAQRETPRMGDLYRTKLILVDRVSPEQPG
jgi:hypothetical protein